MIFGKHINRYYLKYAGWLLLGLATLAMVDYLQLQIVHRHQGDQTQQQHRAKPQIIPVDILAEYHNPFLSFF